MRGQREQGRSVLFITHRLNEVIQYCDRATILRDGGAVATIVPQEGGEEAIVEHMLGEEVARAAAAAAAARRADADGRRRAAPSGVPALEVDDLTVARRQGVSFSLAPGEILGIAALEGQGQDELFDVLSGATLGRRRRDPRRRQAAEGASPVRRDPGRRRARARPTACTRCCRSARCARTSPSPRYNSVAPLGPDQHARRGPPRAQGDRRAADRHARRAARCAGSPAATSRR